MNHPVMSRWGFNLFWYSFWFADKNYSFTLQQDRILTTFFYIYVNFGLLHFSYVFINKYWYSNFNFNFDYSLVHDPKYFRFFNTSSDSAEMDSYYRTRIQVATMYESRIWILRFRNWFFLNFYSFHPRQTRLVIKKVAKAKRLLTNNFICTPYDSANTFKRLKFVLSYFYFQHLTKLSDRYIF